MNPTSPKAPSCLAPQREQDYFCHRTYEISRLDLGRKAGRSGLYSRIQAVRSPSICLGSPSGGKSWSSIGSTVTCTPPQR